MEDLEEMLPLYYTHSDMFSIFKSSTTQYCAISATKGLINPLHTAMCYVSINTVIYSLTIISSQKTFQDFLKILISFCYSYASD